VKIINIKSYIPNFLTSFRLLSAPILICIFYFDNEVAKILATLIFIISALTDFLDGYLARSWNVHSVFGQILDPIADKLIVITAIAMLIYKQQITNLDIFPALSVIMREIIISGLRESLAGFKLQIPVNKIGKWKTGMQMTSISVLLATTTSLVNKYFPFPEYIHLIGVILFWISAFLTIYSGCQYGLKAFDFFCKNKSYSNTVKNNSKVIN
jgi:cardiolipin synthase